MRFARLGSFPSRILAALSMMGLLALPGVAAASWKDVAYASPDAFRILASYYRPDSASTGGVVILPDPKEGRGAWVAVAESLRTAGFHVLVPDLRGTGQSFSQRGVRRDRARFTRGETAAAGLDAEAAMRYLRDLPDTGIRAVVLIGSGKGASSVFGGRKIAFERFGRILVSPGAAEEGEDWAGAIAEQPGELLVIVTNHDLTGVDVAASLIPKDGSKECWMVEGSERGPDLFRSRSDLLAPLVQWIRGSLESP
jgi:pimeloyl-ACP methyl ester carboxylesterase